MLDTSALEKRVKKAVEVIRQLKSENTQLKIQVTRNSEAKEEAKKKIDELIRELEISRSKERDLGKEEKIRRKISGLIEKLDSI